MALKFLSNISLEGNEIQNVKIHPSGTQPTASAAEGGLYYDSANNRLMAHDGSSWYSVNGDVEDVTSGNTNLLTVTGTTAAPQLNIQTAAVIDGGTKLATGDQIYDFVTTQIGGIADSDTTYSVSVTDGVNEADIVLTAGGSGSGTDAVTIKGDSNVSVEGSGDDITISLKDDIIIAGNLTVQGTTTTVDSNTVNIGDNIITLNSDETGTPSQDGGIEIERGTSNNVSLVFDEGTDRWQFTNDGTTFYNIPEPADYDTYVGGSSTDLDTSGAQVIDQIDLNDGAVQSITTRNLTLADLGYTGATDANNYVHPTFDGDDISIDTGALIGANVISDLDFNITTDTNGHVTDANATISTRALTASDIGAQAAGTYNTIIGTDTDLDADGIEVIDQINVTDGVITSMSKRSMQSASTTLKGVVELATNTEAIAGTDTSRAVTPAGVAAAIASGISANSYSTTIGNGTLTTIPVTHNLNSLLVKVEIYDSTTGETVYVETSRDSVNTLELIFASAPASGAYTVLVSKI